MAQARVTSEPKVAGSNPAAGESWRSSAGRAMDSLGPKIPAAKETGMVRNRDTSTPMEGGAVSLALWPFIPPGLKL